MRVPLLNASLTDFVFEASRPVTAEEINSYFEEAAAGKLKGIKGVGNACRSEMLRREAGVSSLPNQ